MDYTGPERRKYPRLAHQFMVHYRMLDSGGAMDLSQTKNISLGGMLFTTGRPFTKGTALVLKIKLPGMEPIIPVGEVIDSHEACEGSPVYDTRIQFSSLSVQDKALLASILNNFFKK